MAYEKQTWVDGVTPLDAEHLNHMEQGIFNANGNSGEDGGYYTPEVTQPAGDTMEVSFTPSKATMPEVASKKVTLPAGTPGADGKSAYAYAVEGGYTGTEAQFAAKLAAEKVANPNALTFTGAVTGSYDGSEALTVNIPSGGGSSGAGRLICDITLTEESKSVEITADSDGNNFGLSEVWIFYEGSSTKDSNTFFSVYGVEKGVRWVWSGSGISSTGASRKGCAHGVLIAPGIVRGDIIAINSNPGVYAVSAYNVPVAAYDDKITSLKFTTDQSLTYAFMAGTNFKVYGR